MIASAIVDEPNEIDNDSLNIHHVSKPNNFQTSTSHSLKQADNPPSHSASTFEKKDSPKHVKHTASQFEILSDGEDVDDENTASIIQ